jgi:hypothetical protein
MGEANFVVLKFLFCLMCFLQQRDMRKVFELECAYAKEGISFGDVACKNRWWANYNPVEVKKVLSGVLALGVKSDRGVIYAVPFYYAKYQRIFWFCKSSCQMTQSDMQKFKEEPHAGPPFPPICILTPEQLSTLMQRGGYTLCLPETGSIPTK